MAKFCTDFGTDVLEAAPAGFTSQWKPPEVFKVIETSSRISFGKKGAFIDNASGSYSDWRLGLKYDPAGIAEDMEILARLYSQERDYTDTLRLFLRGSGSAGAESAYYVKFDSGRFSICKYVNGTASTLADTYYAKSAGPLLFRFGVQGSTLRLRWWTLDEPEPAEWLLTAEDSDLTSGWAGLGRYYGDWITFDFFSVGTGADSADFPVGLASTALISSVHTEILATAPQAPAKIASVHAEILATAPPVPAKVPSVYLEILASPKAAPAPALPTFFVNM